MNYSIVIPTYGRPKHLKSCLDSIEIQSKMPIHVFVIDNNIEINMIEHVKDLVENRSSKQIKYQYIKGKINSGAVARNHGASLVKTELVAFLDDDVVLDKNYYELIIDIFLKNEKVVGAQGLDKHLVDNYLNIKSSFFRRFIMYCENFFENSFIIKKENAELKPSLAVTHPIPDKKFSIESQWISTCAGVFKTDLFAVIEFPKNFVKYSWNEYVFFSYNIYKKKLGKMIYTSSATYRNIDTDSGRVPLIELFYMAEVYDLYIYSSLFKTNFSNKYIYIKSRIGRLLFYFCKMIYRMEFDLSVLFHLIRSLKMAYENKNEIRKGNFDCYNKKFPL